MVPHWSQLLTKGAAGGHQQLVSPWGPFIIDVQQSGASCTCSGYWKIFGYILNGSFSGFQGLQVFWNFSLVSEHASSSMLLLLASPFHLAKASCWKRLLFNSICSFAVPLPFQLENTSFLLVLPSARKIVSVGAQLQLPKATKHWTIAAAALLCARCCAPGATELCGSVSLCSALSCLGGRWAGAGISGSAFVDGILRVTAARFLVTFCAVLCVSTYLGDFFLWNTSWSSALLSLRKCVASQQQKVCAGTRVRGKCSVPVSAFPLQATRESCFSRGMMALLVPLEMKILLGAHGKYFCQIHCGIWVF